jgi:hypothetical protein
MTVLVPALIALAALVGIAASVRARRRGWPWLVLAQAIAAVVLVLLLARAQIAPAPDALVVLSAGDAGSPPSPVRGQMIVALPGANAPAGAQRVPDLATALRRHPGTRALRVHGEGLSARDREAAAGLRLTFEPESASVGIVALDMPDRVVAGAAWRLRGRVAGIAGARVELRDPAGRVVDGAGVDAEGAFELGAGARSEGRVEYTLAVLDAAGEQVDALRVPLVVEPGAAPRVLVLAGAPDPELRALRRWSVDAGFELASHIALAPGLAQRRGETALAASALARLDLLVVDPRSWAALPAGERAGVVAAVREGLGLLLRVNGPLPAAVAEDWRELGFAIAPAEIAEGVALAAPPRAPAWPELTRRPVTVSAADSIVLLSAQDGAALALWRPLARGRVGATWLTDSYKLAQSISLEAYGSVWSGIVRTLARARGQRALEAPREARVDQRVVLCGVAPGSQVIATDGSATPLVVQADDARGCAAYWPAIAGWQRLQSAGLQADFHVRASGDAAALESASRRDATAALARASAGVDPPSPPRPALPAWLLFVAWLAVTAAIWWRERRMGERAFG